MKKIIFILFLFFLLYACYYIYNATEDKKMDILVIGDEIANNPYFDKLGSINNSYINSDYHITDLLNIIKYNQEVDNESIHRLLRDSDILIVSIGINDLYYKLNDSTRGIYTYINNMISVYQEILSYISKYDYKKVYILGYYNTYDRYNDIFTYVNYKLRKIVNKYGYTYINLNKILDSNGKIDLNNSDYRKIYELIVENLNNY